jgi:hypothetical protein
MHDGGNLRVTDSEVVTKTRHQNVQVKSLTGNPSECSGRAMLSLRCLSSSKVISKFSVGGWKNKHNRRPCNLPKVSSLLLRASLRNL